MVFDPKSFEHRCVELVVERTDNDGCLDEGMRDLCHVDIRKMLAKERGQAFEAGAKAMREVAARVLDATAVEYAGFGYPGTHWVNMAYQLRTLPLPVHQQEPTK